MRKGVAINDEEGRMHGSATEQPEQDAQNYADEERRCDRQVEAEIFALDDDVSGEAAEAALGEQGPQEPERHEDQAKDDEPATHGHTIHIGWSAPLSSGFFFS